MFWPFRRRTSLGIFDDLRWSEVINPQQSRELAPETKQWRAEQAKRLLADPLLREAFEAVGMTYAKAWYNTADGQERERERLWLMLGMLRAVRRHLESAVEDGKVVDQRKAIETREKKFGPHPIR